MGDSVYVQQTTTPAVEWRWAAPFVGILGWIFYVWDLFVVLALMCTLTDNWNNAPALFISIVCITIVLGIAFWLVNGFWFMPYYATRQSRHYHVENGVSQLPETVMVREERSYAGKVREDLRAHNDQEHFQGEVWRNIIILIFLGVVMGQRGTASFQPIPAVFTNLDVMNYVIIKCFQLLILASAAWAFGQLADCKSDFLWRHMTAENVQYVAKNGGDKALGKPLGRKQVNLV